MKRLNRLFSNVNRWALTYLLAALAAASALLLAGLSGWLVGAVIFAGTAPAAIGLSLAAVRVLALLRTGAKYGERVVGHRAAISDQITHRQSLFRAFAAARSTRQSGWQLAKPARLADFLEDVEAVEYDRLRSTLPVLTAGLAFALLALATAAVTPLALVGVLPFAALALVLRPFARRLQENEALQRAEIRQAAERLDQAIAGAVALEAEGRREQAVTEALDHCRALEEARTQQAEAEITAEAAAGLFAPVLGLTVILAAGWSGLSGPWLLAAVFVSFAWLGYGELLHPLVRGAFARLRARLASTGLATRPCEAVSPGRQAIISANSLRVRDLVPVSPAGTIMGAPLSFTARPGAPIAIVGPSGSGKSSLLKQLAGWSEAPIGTIDLGRATGGGAQRTAQIHLALHDAAILSDTLRENLFAPDAGDEAIWAALECVELADVVVAKGGLEAWITQEDLSKGEAQRLNLARAILSRKPVVLLDEPWEHLDQAQGQRVATATLNALRNRAVVFTTHHLFDCAAQTVALGMPEDAHAPHIPAAPAMVRSLEHSRPAAHALYRTQP